MDLLPFFQSVLEQDRAPIVLCNLEHEIIYMNESAKKQYKNRRGVALLGRSLLACHNEKSREMICRTVAWFRQSGEHNTVYEFRNEEENKDVYMIALRDGEKKLIGYYEKHEYRDREKANLYDFSE